MTRTKTIWQPNEERNHKRPVKPTPGVNRGSGGKVRKGERTRSGRVTK